MKKLPSIILLNACFLLSFYNYCTESQNFYSPQQIEFLEQKAHSWANQHIPSLNPKDIQLVANTLYLSYILAFFDTQARKQTHEFLKLAWNVRQEIVHYTDTDSIINTMCNTCNTLQAIVHEHQPIWRTWQSCTKYLETEQHVHTDAFNAIALLQDQAQTIIREYVDQDQQQQSIHLALETAQQTLYKAGDMFHRVAKFYQGLIDGDTLQEVSPENKHIAVIDTASRLGSTVEEHAWNSMQEATQFAKYEAVLQEISIVIFAAYYKALYSTICSLDLNKKYLTLMFNENGFIPEEERITMLPAPEMMYAIIE